MSHWETERGGRGGGGGGGGGEGVADWRPGNEEGRNLRDSRKTHPASMTDLFPTFFLWQKP